MVEVSHSFPKGLVMRVSHDPNHARFTSLAVFYAVCVSHGKSTTFMQYAQAYMSIGNIQHSYSYVKLIGGAV